MSVATNSTECRKNSGFSSKTVSKKKQYNKNVEKEAMQPRTKERKKKYCNVARNSEESVTKPFSGWRGWRDGVVCVRTDTICKK